MAAVIALVVIICAFILLLRMDPKKLTLKIWKMIEVSAERDPKPPARLPSAHGPKALPPPKDQGDEAA